MVHIVLQMCLYERLRRRRRIRRLSVYFSNLYVASRDNVPNTLEPVRVARGRGHISRAAQAQARHAACRLMIALIN